MTLITHHSTALLKGRVILYLYFPKYMLSGLATRTLLLSTPCIGLSQVTTTMDNHCSPKHHSMFRLLMVTAFFVRHELNVHLLPPLTLTSKLLPKCTPPPVNITNVSYDGPHTHTHTIDTKFSSFSVSHIIQQPLSITFQSLISSSLCCLSRRTSGHFLGILKILIFLFLTFSNECSASRYILASSSTFPL
jgi:hypothetical protein